MGRPREHDERVGATLLAVAERLVRAGGPAAITVRALAAETGTTTRAVYSVFGSKEGLLTALAADAFDRLGTAVDDIPRSDDAVADAVACILDGYRRWALANPDLYRLAFARLGRREPTVGAAARRALQQLRARVRRIEDAGRMRWNADAATVALQCLCEGLVDVELRGTLLADGADELWRDSVRAMLRGMAHDGPS